MTNNPFSGRPDTSKRPWKLIDNYIWISTLGNEGEFVLIPEYPDTMSDSLKSSFQETNALGRSAPIFSYSNSGPRTVRVSINLHRDVMQELNYNVSNMEIEDMDDDYVDAFIKKIQAVSVPKYMASGKTVQPPTVAVRFGNELFIKGIVNGGVTVSYTKPILDNNKYAQVGVAFDIYETDPVDSETIAEQGSFRGVTKTFKNGIYEEGD